MNDERFLAEVVDLLNSGIIFDRSDKPIRPIATVVASARNKDRDIDAGHFVRELWMKYPYARLVVTEKSPVEKAAIEMAELLEMPVEVIEPAGKGEWDYGSHLLDEKVVSRASHIVAFDQSSRSENYRKLAARTFKHFSSI